MTLSEKQETIYSIKNEGEQWDFIYKYRPKSDTFILRNAFVAMGTISGITGAYINAYYRNRLKMRHYGTLATYMPLILVPAVTSATYHHMFITSSIVFEKQPCAVCLEMNSQAIQFSLGLLYPLIMGPICTYMVANRYYTTRIPSITEKPKELWVFHKTMSKKLFRNIWYIAALQVIATSLITYAERKQFIDLKAKLEEISNIMSSKI